MWRTTSRLEEEKHRRLGTQAQDRRNSYETTTKPKFAIKTLENPGVPISSKSDNFSLHSLLGDPPPKKPSFFGQKMFGPKCWGDFWNQHPRKPPCTKFHQNRTTLVFGHFLGVSPPKNLSFFGRKKFGPKFWCYFWNQHLRKALQTELQQNRVKIGCWLKIAYLPKKYAKKFS